MIQHIIDNIFLGDYQDAQYNNIHFEDIFTVAKDSPYIGNHHYPLIDAYSIDNEELLYSAIYDLIITREQKNSNILVHCIAGLSRSPTVVAGYMIIKKGYDINGALWYIKNIRPLANPNPELTRLLERLYI